MNPVVYIFMVLVGAHLILPTFIAVLAAHEEFVKMQLVPTKRLIVMVACVSALIPAALSVALLDFIGLGRYMFFGYAHFFAAFFTAVVFPCLPVVFLVSRLSSKQTSIDPEFFN